MAGRKPGSQNRRTVMGKQYALDLLEQTKVDETYEDPNPVKERLKQQFRAGVGNGSRTVETFEGPQEVDCIPAAFFTHTMDRAWGKVADKMDLNLTDDLSEVSSEELEKRAAKVLSEIRKAQRAKGSEED